MYVYQSIWKSEKRIGKRHTLRNALFFLTTLILANVATGQETLDSSARQSQNVFESTTGNFKVEFPGAPQQSVSQVPTDFGVVDLVSFLYEASAKELYLVAYYDYPMNVMATTTADKLLSDAKESSVQSLGLRDVKIEEVDVSGFRGLQFQGSSDFYFASHKVAVVQNRSYKVVVLKSDGSYAQSEEEAHFLNSFKLIDPSIAEYGEFKKEEEAVIVEEEVIFSPPQGNFTIHFPVDPERTTRMVNSDFGPLEMKQFSCDVDEKQYYIIAYTDYPETLIENSKIEDLLQAGKKEALKVLGIDTIDFEEPIQIDEYPGLHFRGQNGEQFIEYRVYMVKKRLFQMTILSPDEYPSEVEIDGFMNSFTLSK